MVGFALRFFYILGKRRGSLLLLVGLFLLVSLLEAVGIGLVGPFMALATDFNAIHRIPWTNWLYRQIHFQSDIQFISAFGLGIVALLYIKSFLGFGIQRYIFAFGFSQQANLRSQLMQAYLRAPYVFHLDRNTAVLIQSIIVETEKFANAVLMPLLFSAANLTVVIALLILLFKTSFVATTFILIVLSLISVVLYQFRNKIALWGQSGHASNVEMIRVINHGLGSLKETKVIGCEDYFENQMVAEARKFQEAVTAFNAFSLLPRYTLEPLLITFLVGFTITYLTTNQNADSLTAILSVFGMASIRLLPAASSLMQSYGSIRNSGYIVDQLCLDLKELEKIGLAKTRTVSDAIAKTIPLLTEKSQKSTLSFNRQITLENVVYRYPNVLEPSLKSVSLKINKGESIGLIGKSGAGKTTLADIILGLLEPEVGEIKVDGVSIKDNLRGWQNLVGYIPQSIFLVDGTIEHNIAFGVPDDQIDSQKLDKAIKAAQLTDLIQQLPEGIKTKVGERGVRLSGGQRQRVGIARALYHEREILVLDEATAALDNETENLVTEAIKSLSRTKTMIIIAHRLSTLEHCDRLYLMEKGQIVRSGSYQEVVLNSEPRPDAAACT